MRYDEWGDREGGTEGGKEGGRQATDILLVIRLGDRPSWRWAWV